ncbi:hypothetical protein A2U01_0039486, partial [Trifolium medium]|nr:hypothetical protein [Trifolium medium]
KFQTIISPPKWTFLSAMHITGDLGSCWHPPSPGPPGFPTGNCAKEDCILKFQAIGPHWKSTDCPYVTGLTKLWTW